MSYYEQSDLERQTIWLPCDQVREAAKISYKKFYYMNLEQRKERIKMLRKIYRPGIINNIFERKLVNYFILHPHDDIDGERFINLLELLPSDKVWNLQFAYSSWRPQINLCWGVYRKTLTNLENSKVLLTMEEAYFIQANSGIKLLKA